MEENINEEIKSKKCKSNKVFLYNVPYNVPIGVDTLEEGIPKNWTVKDSIIINSTKINEEKLKKIKSEII